MIIKILIAVLLFVNLAFSADTDQFTGKVTVYKGDVKILNNKLSLINPTVGMEITEDSWIKTGPDSWIKINLNDKKKVTVEANNFIKLSEYIEKQEHCNNRGIIYKFFTRKKKHVNLYYSTGIRGKEIAPEISKNTGYEWAEKEDKCNNLINAAYSSYSNKRYNLAIAAGLKFTDKCKKRKEIENIYLILGYSYHELAQFDKSNNFFEKIINNKKSALKEDGLFMMGINCNYLKFYERAIKILKDYILKYPKGKYAAETIFMAGLIYEAMGNTDKANDYYEIIIEKYPSHDEFYSICKEKLGK